MTTPVPPPKPTAHAHIRPDRKREPSTAAKQWADLAIANPGAWFRVDLPPSYTEEDARAVRLDLEATRWCLADERRQAVSARTEQDDTGRYIRYRVYHRQVVGAPARTRLRQPRKAASGTQPQDAT